MSGKKYTHENTTAGIVTSDSRGPKGMSARNKSYMLAAVVLIIVSAITFMFVYNKPKEKIKNVEKSDFSYNSVIGNVNDSNYEKAQQLLTAQLKSANNDDKVHIYAQQFTLAQSINKFDEAMAFARKAESTKATSQTAQLIAMAARNQGDKKTAIEFYKKAIERLDPKSEVDQVDANDFKDEITKLGGEL